MFKSSTLNENEIYALRHFQDELADILETESLPPLPDRHKVDLVALTDPTDRAGLRSLSSKRMIDIERTITEEDGCSVIKSEVAMLNDKRIGRLIEEASRCVIGTPPNHDRVEMEEVDAADCDPRLPYLVHLCTAPWNNDLENRCRTLVGDAPMAGRFNVVSVNRLPFEDRASRAATFASVIMGAMMCASAASNLIRASTSSYEGDLGAALILGVVGVGAFWLAERLARKQIVATAPVGPKRSATTEWKSEYSDD